MINNLEFHSKQSQQKKFKGYWLLKITPSTLTVVLQKADSSISLNDINLFVRAVGYISLSIEFIEKSNSLERDLLIWSLFTSKGHRSLSTSFMQEIFLVQYSPDSSNNHIHEEAVIRNWFNYLQDCEGMNIVT